MGHAFDRDCPGSVLWVHVGLWASKLSIVESLEGGVVMIATEELEKDVESGTRRMAMLVYDGVYCCSFLLAGQC